MKKIIKYLPILGIGLSIFSFVPNDYDGVQATSSAPTHTNVETYEFGSSSFRADNQLYVDTAVPGHYNVHDSTTVSLKDFNYNKGYFASNTSHELASTDAFVVEFYTQGVTFDRTPSTDVTTAPEICIAGLHQDTSSAWGHMVQIGLNGQGIRSTGNGSLPLKDSFGNDINGLNVNMSGMMHGSIWRFVFDAEGGCYFYVTDGDKGAKCYDEDNLRLYVAFPSGKFAAGNAGKFGIMGNSMDTCGAEFSLRNLKYGKISNWVNNNGKTYADYNEYFADVPQSGADFNQNIDWFAQDIINGCDPIQMSNQSVAGGTVSYKNSGASIINATGKSGIIWNTLIDSTIPGEVIAEATLNWTPGSSGKNNYIGIHFGADKTDIGDQGIFIGVADNSVGGNQGSIFDFQFDNPDGYGELLTQNTVNVSTTNSLYVKITRDSNDVISAYYSLNNGTLFTHVLPNNNIDGYVAIGNYTYNHNGWTTNGGANAKINSFEFKTQSYYKLATDLAELEDGQTIVLASPRFKQYVTGLDNNNFITSEYSNLSSFDTAQAFTLEISEGKYYLHDYNSNKYLAFDGQGGFPVLVEEKTEWKILNEYGVIVPRGYVAANNLWWSISYNKALNQASCACRYGTVHPDMTFFIRVSSSYISNLKEEYLRMNTYNSNDGLCYGNGGYYSQSKNYLITLGEDAINDFKDAYYNKNALARYEAWARYNNDSNPYIKDDTYLKQANLNTLMSSHKDFGGIGIFIAISSINVIVLLVINKKKKRKEIK